MVSIMTRSREQLHSVLLSVMAEAYRQTIDEADGEYEVEDFSHHVYYQPPDGLQMKYPALVYEKSSASTQFADDRPYIYTNRYTLTVIDADPDSLIPDNIGMLPRCTKDRHFVVDNLHHDVFVMYY